MKTIIQIFLALVVLVLSYLVYESIQKPIRFQNQYDIRQKAVVAQLIAIRSAEVAYNSVNGRYTGSFDTLITFVKTGKLPLVKMEGSLSDSLLETGMTEIKALKLGIIKRDTIFVNVKDSLFRSNLSVDSLRFIPFVDDGAQFELKSASIVTASTVRVQVFECKVPNVVFLKGMDRSGIKELNYNLLQLEKYPGLKVGSLTETNNNAGNWE